MAHGQLMAGKQDLGGGSYGRRLLLNGKAVIKPEKTIGGMIGNILTQAIRHYAKLG